MEGKTWQVTEILILIKNTDDDDDDLVHGSEICMIQLP